MKAFMSDRDERPAGACDRLTCCNAILRGIDANAAVAEARRILADVEPDGPQTACFGIERIAARNCAPNAWTSALADALAAFVAD